MRKGEKEKSDGEEEKNSKWGLGSFLHKLHANNGSQRECMRGRMIEIGDSGGSVAIGDDKLKGLLRLGGVAKRGEQDMVEVKGMGRMGR